MLTFTKFRIRICVEPDGDQFYASCPDIGCIHASGSTQEEAKNNAVDAVRAYLDVSRKYGDPIPQAIVAYTSMFTPGQLFKTWATTLLSPKRKKYDEVFELGPVDNRLANQPS